MTTTVTLNKYYGLWINSTYANPVLDVYFAIENNRTGEQYGLSINNDGYIDDFFRVFYYGGRTNVQMGENSITINNNVITGGSILSGSTTINFDGVSIPISSEQSTGILVGPGSSVDVYT